MKVESTPERPPMQGRSHKRLLVLLSVLMLLIVSILIAPVVNIFVVVAKCGGEWSASPDELAQGVASLGGQEVAARKLRWYLHLPGAPHRRAALDLLGECGKDGLRVLLPLLKNKNAKVRFEVLSVLRTMKDRDSGPAIVEATRDEDISVRWMALYALWLVIDAKEGVVVAEQRLRDVEPSVRVAAAEALVRYGAASSIEPLKAAIAAEEVAAEGFANPKEHMEDALKKLIERVNADAATAKGAQTEPKPPEGGK